MSLRLRDLLWNRIVIATFQLFVFVTLISVIAPATPAQAATYTVSKTADTDDGTCDADCSLREAITAANATAANDTITFAATGTISLTGLPPIITNNGTLTINGGGTITVSKSFGSYSIFNIATNATVTINDLTISNGGGNASDFGGAIYNEGVLTVNRSTLRNNGVTLGGGGIHNLGTLTVTNSIFANNTSSLNGGAVFNTGLSTTIINSLFYMNGATNGGAIRSQNGTLTVINSTFSGNGALNGADLAITTSVAHLRNSILANQAVGNSCVVIMATLNAENSLIESGLTCVNGTNTNNLTGDPALNGSYMLSSGSIAINAGNNSLIPGGMTTDLAGNARIQGGTVDMGAYESSFSVPLTVQLTLQGRPTAPNAAYMVSGEVEVRPTSGGAPIIDTTFIADNMGRFTIANVPVGTVDIWVKGSHTLARLHEDVAVVAAGTLTTALLLEGDANNDNVVQLIDFSLLAASFGTQAGNPSYDTRADFNMDGLINLTDFSLLASNFAVEGDE